MKKIAKIAGSVLILIGIVLFLIASIGFSAAKTDPNIVAPEGMEVVVPENHPERMRLEARADGVMLFSGMAGGLGILCLIAGFTLPAPTSKKIGNEE